MSLRSIPVGDSLSVLSTSQTTDGCFSEVNNSAAAMRKFVQFVAMIYYFRGDAECFSPNEIK